LAGVSTELSVIMLVFLDVCWKEHKAAADKEGRQLNLDDLKSAILEGGALRVRPKAMTAAAIIGGLLPVMYGTGTGSEIMSRIAAPMVGGMLSAVLLTLLVLPAVYFLWKKRSLKL
jgi:Cu(I)/Ag(I) efflux system membrane protein CusA/SilA